ncbi:small ribosomal subunit protein mS29-like isoform X1 [Haliotis cracherodii]|uniref:small ribosomal subunit protein mS29-like isoform X1 n=2 Tax=Haliotis cracherodii TaxID=6455 RepID=UPI0039EB86F8
MDASRQVLAKMWKGALTGTRCMCRPASRKTLQSVVRQLSSRCTDKSQTRLSSSLADQADVPLNENQTRIKPVCRTSENNPLHHSGRQQGQHYTVPPGVYKDVLQRALPLEFKKQVKTFGEACVMIREPALEVMNYIRNLNLDLPASRIVLYGRRGSGRSMSLAHIMHYCAEDQWIILHAPWPITWNREYKEISQSSHKPNRIDHPAHAGEWLLNFQAQNKHLLKDIKIQSSYYWTKRESAEKGTPLLDIVEFGMNRIKFAADCVGVILKELKQHANQKQIKVMVAVDGVNSLWAPTKIRTDEKEIVPASNISLVHNFKKILKSDWTNGVIVCTVDPMANTDDQREHDTPQYLLGKEGFECMDPFIPVLVPYYTEKEAHSCIQYFIDMNWIQTPEGKTEDGKKELIFLSNQNPYLLTRICASR